MIKITEITEEKARTCYKVDAFGNRVRDIEYVLVKRQIKTIKSGPRFVHFLIDIIILSLLISIYSFFYLMIKVVLIDFDLVLSLLNFIDSYFILFIPFYYIILEYKFQKTIGKFFTNTIVINEYGNKPDFNSIVIRNFARLVPFEFFSCLGDNYSYGWHDKWSKTWVVTKEELNTIKKLQIEIEEKNSSLIQNF
jgi:uncharacterized RDD family membrane protein YckC